MKELIDRIIKDILDIAEAEKELAKKYGIRVIGVDMPSKCFSGKLHLNNGIDEVAKAMKRKCVDAKKDPMFRPQKGFKIKNIDVFQLAEEVEYKYKKAWE